VITHDLAVISELCDRVMVMYLGKDVESAPARELFRNPKHPYTVGLLRSVPALGKGRTQVIEAIEGAVPSLAARPPGCPFHPRCPQFIANLCDVAPPPLVEVARGHNVRCHLYG
jgi:oligopeptide/dipeptide ABC transporter ATP-binding protein